MTGLFGVPLNVDDSITYTIGTQSNTAGYTSYQTSNLDIFRYYL